MINSLSLYHPKAKNLPKINGHNLCSTYTSDERRVWYPTHVSIMSGFRVCFMSVLHRP